MAPAKTKRVSKKNKKSWRKNVDLKDVDNFLEDQRLEERLGVKYSEQKDEDLFLIDTKGDDESVAAKTETVPVFKPKVKVSDHSLRLRETETPKCFEALVKRSAVPGHFTKRKNITIKNSNSAVARSIIKRKVKKEALKVKRLAKVGSNSSNPTKTRKEATYDLWSKENTDYNLNGCSDWLTNDTIRHTLHNTGKCKKQIPKTILSKTSQLPAIDTPHPGTSYNPSLKDHKDILEKVAEAEVKVIKENQHINRVTTKMFEKLPRAEVEKQWLSEMTVGLSQTLSESDEDDGEYKAVNPPVKNKKKTLKKRRKLKEALLEKEKQRQQKIEKKKLSDIYRLRKFKEVIDKKEQKTLKNMQKRKEKKEKKVFSTKLLSQVKYEEPEMDFHLAEELSGNLRNVKPEGNILYDRFKSLQKRNILQPGLKRYVKKKKVKKYEPACKKMGWEPKGYIPYEENTSSKT